jgi:hypothetical protein
MNDQIKQLLDQAQELAREEVKNTPELAKYAPSYAIPGTEIHVGLRLSYEKFAELIVGNVLLNANNFWMIQILQLVRCDVRFNLTNISELKNERTN